MMSAAVNYAGDKSRIRAELVKLAHAGELTYYGVLGTSVGKPPRWPLWKTVLDEIHLETPKTDPDITFLVLNASTGWPGQIGFIATGESQRQNKRRMRRTNSIVYFDDTVRESQLRYFRSASADEASKAEGSG